MDKFEINSPGPEFKPMTTAYFQKEYGHIPHVTTQKSRPSAPLTPENRTNGHKPIPEPIPIQLDNTSQFSTLQPDDIPAEDFFIISKDVERTEFKSNLILTNILNRYYGRVFGRGGQNAKRLEQKYGVKINFFDGRQENFKLIISKGDADSRRAASDDIIENLPVVAQCPNLMNNPGVTICGRLSNCRQAYKLLLDNGDNIFHLE